MCNRWRIDFMEWKWNVCWKNDWKQREKWTNSYEKGEYLTTDNKLRKWMWMETKWKISSTRRRVNSKSCSQKTKKKKKKKTDGKSNHAVNAQMELKSNESLSTPKITQPLISSKSLKITSCKLCRFFPHSLKKKCNNFVHLYLLKLGNNILFIKSTNCTISVRVMVYFGIGVSWLIP